MSLDDDALDARRVEGERAMYEVKKSNVKVEGLESGISQSDPR